MPRGRPRKTISILSTSDPVPTESDRIIEPQISHKELLKALYTSVDILGRSGIRILLLGETAKEVREGKNLMSPLHLGTGRTEFVGRSRAIVESLVKPDSEEGYELTFTFEGLPVRLSLVDTTSKHFSSPDAAIYGFEAWYIPNEFNVYFSKKDQFHT